MGNHDQLDAWLVEVDNLLAEGTKAMNDPDLPDDLGGDEPAGEHDDEEEVAAEEQDNPNQEEEDY